MRSLPRANTRLTGREAEISLVTHRVGELLDTRGYATVFLSGQPGAGKSAIAIKAAWDLLPLFPGGVLYFEMRGDIETRNDRVAKNIQVSPQHVAADVLTIFDRTAADREAESPSNDEELYTQYAEALRNQRVLIVLDNAYDIGQIDPLLRNAQTSFIVTSRDRSVSFSSLDRAALARHVPVLSRDDSIELLLKFVRDCDGGSRIPSEAASLCERIAHYCDDLPLALNLAGEQLTRRLAGDVTQRLRMLAQQLKDESKRLGRLGIGPVISLSYASLDDATRRHFRMSCTTRTAAIKAEELAYCMDISASTAEDSLSRLVDGSLAAYGVESVRRSLTFTLYQMIRLFADWRRQEEESHEAITEFRRRFVNYVREQVVDSRDSSYPDPEDEFETAGVMTALQLAQETGCLEAGIEIAQTFTRALPVEAEMARILEAQRILAELHVQAGRVSRAVDEWMAFAERMEDENRSEQAINAYQAARDLASQHGELRRTAEVAFALGLLLESRNDLDPAFEAMSDAATVLLEMHLPGDQQRVIALPAVINCAKLADRRSDEEEELRWARTAGGIARECPDAALSARAHAMFQLGLALWTEDPAESIQSLVTAGQWFEETGQFGNAAIAAENAACLASGGDRQRFLRVATGRWAQTRSPEDRFRYAAALVKLSAVLAEVEDLGGAVEVLVEATTLLPDDSSNASQTQEAKMRLASLRLLDGASSKEVDFADIRDVGSAVELSKEAALLDALSHGALSVTDARGALYNFVCGGPRYEPPSHTAWLHDEMGEPAEATERADDGSRRREFPK